jgi:hypothetical protein
VVAGRGYFPTRRGVRRPAAHQLVATTDLILPTDRTRIIPPPPRVSSILVPLAALAQLDLDTAGPPGGLIEDCAARLRNGQYSRLRALQ